MEAHIRKKLSFERYAKDFMGAAVSLKGYIPPAANNYCFPGFLPTYSAIRRRINEGSSKDRRRIIEGYTSLIRLKYGLGREQIRL